MKFKSLKLGIVIDCFLLITMLIYKEMNFLILLFLLYTIGRIYVKNDRKNFCIIFIFSILIMISSLFIGIQYKLFFNLISFSLLAFLFKKSWINIITLALIFSPNININKMTVENSSIDKKYSFSYYQERNDSSNKWYEMNGDINNNSLNNIQFYYNQCQLNNMFCEPIHDPVSQNVTSLRMSDYFDRYGNVYQIIKSTGIDSKRYIYDYNKAIAKQNLIYTTIFIPTTKDELVIYNYWLLNDYIFENILEDKNKCKLLFYGTRNGWSKYKNRLIEELKNDKNNSCIFNLEDYNFEINKNKLENDKKEMIRILSQHKTKLNK